MTVSAPTSKPRRARKRKQASVSAHTPAPMPAPMPAPVRALAPVEMQGRTRLSKPTAEIIPFASYIKDVYARVTT